MTNITSLSDLFPSRYLKPADIGDTDLVLTIDRVEIESIGMGDQAETKPVIYFLETSKGLVLNKTNGNTIGQLYGPSLVNWSGKKIGLYKTEVSFQGTTYIGIRVRLRPPTRPPSQGLDDGGEPISLW